MLLLHNHLMDSCSYVSNNILLAAKGGCICTPLTPPKSATELRWLVFESHKVESFESAKLRNFSYE